MEELTRIQIRSGGLAQDLKEAFLTKERIVIGSVVSADVRLQHSSVSPIHAVIEVKQSKDFPNHIGVIYDLASDQGTFLNGQRIVTEVIKVGDVLKVGAVEFTVARESVAIQPSERPHLSAGRERLYVDPKEDLKPLLLEEEREIAEIFDFRPTHKPALEVVLSWNRTILDIEHFTDQPFVEVGDDPSCDFAIPAFLGNGPYKLVERVGADLYLRVHPSMEGVFQTKGSLKTLAELRSGRDSFTQVIGPNDFAKIRVGTVDFYLSYTAAPPRLKRKVLDRDPFFFRIASASLALSAALLAGILSLRVPETIEPEKIPERVAKILFQPEKYVYYQPPQSKALPEKQESLAEKPKEPSMRPKVVKVEVKPTPVDLSKKPKAEMDLGSTNQKQVQNKPKNSQAKVGTQAQKGKQSRGNEGEGARNKGQEGTRGSKQSNRVADAGSASEKAKRPSPTPGTGSGGTPSKVAGEGNLQSLKGASDRISNLLSGSLKRLGNAGSDLKGFGSFSTQGSGGSALSGEGSGGGGLASGLGGLGKKGRGGGRIGTGLGAAGTGGSIVGSAVQVDIDSGGEEEIIVLGSLDRSEILAAIMRHKDEFRICYEREINAEHPDLAGKVLTEFVIGTRGRVTQAGIKYTALKSPPVESCILDVLKRIQFPVPRGGATASISYPFVFNSGSR